MARTIQLRRKRVQSLIDPDGYEVTSFDLLQSDIGYTYWYTYTGYTGAADTARCSATTIKTSKKSGVSSYRRLVSSQQSPRVDPMGHGGMSSSFLIDTKVSIQKKKACRLHIKTIASCESLVQNGGQCTIKFQTTMNQWEIHKELANLDGVEMKRKTPREVETPEGGLQHFVIQ
eukprot:scaffold60102_cov53-Attheya_sp.AAC.4